MFFDSALRASTIARVFFNFGYDAHLWYTSSGGIVIVIVIDGVDATLAGTQAETIIDEPAASVIFIRPQDFKPHGTV